MNTHFMAALFGSNEASSFYGGSPPLGGGHRDHPACSAEATDAEGVRLTHGDSRENAPSTEREVVMKHFDHGYCSRSSVCLSALVIVGGALVMCIFGAYAVFAGPAAWLPQRASSSSVGSLITGLTVAVLGLAGCLGACRRSRPCLCLFGVAVVLLLAASIGCLAVAMHTRWAVDAWRTANYRLYANGGAGPRGDGAEAAVSPAGNLSLPAIRTLVTLHAEVSLLYGFCAPPPNVTAAIVGALDRAAAPTATLRCTEDALSLLGDSCVPRPARAHTRARQPPACRGSRPPAARACVCSQAHRDPARVCMRACVHTRGGVCGPAAG